LGCVSEDARLSTFASPELVREIQRWDKTVTTNLDTRKKGEKKKREKKPTSEDKIETSLVTTL
jgi:hypothetical protein